MTPAARARTERTFELLADKIAQRVIEPVARRVVELLTETPATPRLVDAATIAHHLRVRREWVYDHADELGGQRLGDGPRPRLRFDLDEAVEHYRRGLGSEREAE